MRETSRGWAAATTCAGGFVSLVGAAAVTAGAPATQVLAQVSQAVPAATGVAGTPPAARPAPGDLTVTARDQPIGAFLRDLFGRAGRPVVVSPSLTGTVSGVFRGSALKIYNDVARAFNLVGYDDGAAYYVYAANDVSVQTFAVGRSGADRAVRQAAAQKLTGGRNRLRVAADGSLVASGVPRFIEQVGALARGGDGGTTASGGGGGGGGGFGGASFAPPPPQPLEFRVFYLRYARAEDTVVNAGGRESRVPGLASIIQNLVLDQRPGGSAGTPVQFGARPVRQSANRVGGLGLGAVSADASQTPILSLPSTGSGDVLGGVDVLGTGGAAAGGGGGGGAGLMAPLTQDVVRIEPSPMLNALIVRDVPERMAAYEGLIRALDVEPQVVEVEATIIDINTDKLRRLGINWRLTTGGFGALFGNGDPTSDFDARLSRNPALSRRGNVDAITPSAAGGTISTIIGSGRQFLARITALENRGAARIVQRPQIVTLANSEAVFDRTQTFYVRVGGRLQVDLFNVTAGTVLRVNPHVFRDRDQTRIRMSVNIEDGALNGTLDVDDIPVVERSSVSTQAMVVDGESLLLGGLTADSDINNITKVPLLGDIPLLGELFKYRQRQQAHTERLFLITPRLVSLTRSAAAAAPLPAGGPVAAPTSAPAPMQTIQAVPRR